MIYVALYLVALVPLVIWRAFVMVQLWGWFAVPLGISQIGMAHACGVSLLVSMMTQPQEQPLERIFR